MKSTVQKKVFGFYFLVSILTYLGTWIYLQVLPIPKSKLGSFIFSLEQTFAYAHSTVFLIFFILTSSLIGVIWNHQKQKFNWRNTFGNILGFCLLTILSLFIFEIISFA